jgi:hypothetical protein
MEEFAKKVAEEFPGEIPFPEFADLVPFVKCQCEVVIRGPSFLKVVIHQIDEIEMRWDHVRTYAQRRDGCDPNEDENRSLINKMGLKNMAHAFPSNAYGKPEPYTFDFNQRNNEIVQELTNTWMELLFTDEEIEFKVQMFVNQALKELKGYRVDIKDQDELRDEINKLATALETRIIRYMTKKPVLPPKYSQFAELVRLVGPILRAKKEEEKEEEDVEEEEDEEDVEEEEEEEEEKEEEDVEEEEEEDVEEEEEDVEEEFIAPAPTAALAPAPEHMARVSALKGEIHDAESHLSHLIKQVQDAESHLAQLNKQLQALHEAEA